MGYESLEKDSLITLNTVLERYCRLDRTHSQTWKDAEYELNRINEELNNR